MWQKLMSALGFGETQPTPDAAALEVASQQQAMANAGAAPASEFSLTDETNKVLKRLLYSQYVNRVGYNAGVNFPVQAVTLSASDNSTHGGGIRIGGEAEPNTPRGETVTMEVSLSRPSTDYDKPSLQNALPVVLNMLPGLKGKIIAKPAQQKHATYTDVEKELLALLAKKPGTFSAGEIAVIKQFFEAEPNASDEAPTSHWDSKINARHNEGKVNISIEARELTSDKGTKISSDSVILDYFKAHHDELLNKVKEKAVALGVVKAEDLAKLDLHATANGWSIDVQLGTRPAVEVDATTHEKMTAEQRAKAFTETPLAKIDTNKLSEIFTEALLESNKELQPLMARIISPHMLADVLKKRLHNDPNIAAFIQKHEMFMSVEEKKAQKENALAQGAILIEEPYVGGLQSLSGKNEANKNGIARVSFDLPYGVSLQDLMKSIVSAKNQIGLEGQAQQRAAQMAVGAA